MFRIIFAALILTAGAAQAQERETAIFAGGCFWCVESDFDHVEGVVETTSGYTGGTVADPSYEQVSAGGTGHYESVRVTYDPEVVSYERLAEIFLRTVDPVDAGGQFCDRGDSYRTAIFATEDQRATAEQVKREASEQLGEQVVTPVLEAGTFYPAEGYHQDYYEKNPLQYRFYRWRCGRDARVEELWGEGPEAALDRLG